MKYLLCIILTLTLFFEIKAQTKINQYEYWFDDNYTAKMVKNVTATVSLNISDSINPGLIRSGYHVFHIRFKDENGNWSVVKSSYFIKLGAVGAGELISGYRYWFDDSDTSLVKVTLPVPGAIVQLNDSINAIRTIGKHTITIQFQDNGGLWSAPLKYEFSYCPTEFPKANFEYVASGANVSFINTSVAANNIHWDFGNGDTSNLANPFKRFQPGNYTISLIAANPCNISGDTLTKIISIRGLVNINANHGGNSGKITVKVNGGGFVPGMQLFLNKIGEGNIYGDTLIIKDSVEITTSFDLNGKRTGIWNVTASFPDGKIDTLYNSFTIEAATPPKLWVNITGDAVLRVGFNQIYPITIGNDGNTDAPFVPVLISGLPPNTEIEVLNPLYPYQPHNPSIPYTIQDDEENESARIVYIDNIPGGSTQTINVIFHLPPDAALHTFPTIKVNLGNPAPQQKSSSEHDYESIAKCAGSIIGFVGDVIGVKDFAGCLTGVGDGVLSLAKTYLNFETHQTTGKTLLDGTDLFLGGIETAENCAKAAGTILFPEGKIAKAVLESMKLAKKGLKGFTTFDDCREAYNKNTDAVITPIIGNAWDPNEKYGPGDSANMHYVNELKPLSYTINFENSPNANLNAQTVIVSDTLNPAYFDFKNFGFTSVTIGDSMYILEYPVKSFFHDFDFVDKYGVKARITATFDTLKGIARWTFITIDPSTNQQTQNALVGFLPPDTTSPKGQGYVSYIVRPNPELKTGDTICNNATIIFDSNAPITTNCWQNYFDFVSPGSYVETLPKISNKEGFEVKWKGSDNLSGVRKYTVYVSVNDSAFTPWLIDIPDTTSIYNGNFGNKYSFFSIATDKAGNIEQFKDTIEATTFLTLKLTDSICSGENVFFASGNSQSGNIYQWQVDKGFGFINVTTSGLYSGANSDTLRLTAVPDSFALYKYRCIIIKGNIQDTSVVDELHIINNWTGTISSSWENPNNWSCFSIPTAYTDVIIEKSALNPVILNSNGICRSITFQPGTVMTIKPGYVLTVTK